jgi:Peptidase family M1 domain
MKQLLVVLSLLACGTAVQPAVSAEDAQSSDAQCDLVIKVQPVQRRLEASGTVRLPAAKTARESVAFSLRADMSDLRIEVLFPQACVGAADVRAKAAPQPGQDTEWTVRPQHPFPAGSDISLKFSYAGGKKQSFVFYLGSAGCFAGGPNSAWYPQFDSGRSTGSLRFEVPKGWIVKATGNPVKTGDQGAASIFEFTVIEPSMYSFAIGKYIVRRHEGKVPTTVYLLRDRPFAKKMVEGLGKVLDVLVGEFGPYPYGKEFAIVETPSPQSEMSGFSGASVEGFMFVTTASLRGGFNLALFGHELSHQWWGNLVKHAGGKGAYMLDEAMAQYGSLRCVEEIEGPKAAARYRWTGYPGYSNMQCGRGALQMWAKGSDHALDDLPSPSLVSHNLADSKGFLVYHLLARTIGPDRFRQALHKLTEQHAFGTLSWHDFTQAVQDAGGKDLGWFYDQWFTRTGAPVLSLKWVQEQDKLRCTIRQSEPTYQLTMPLYVEFAGHDPATHEVEVRGVQTEVSLPAPARVTAVTLDPLYHVPHMTPAIKDELTKAAGR